ncbi:hypothetical protein B0T14DRAFT_552646 [Immersiella caudata]|uniref:Uncharacterized protein n=1 Tax=Immersiella caudata TaxID=314043 RepID=A0AA40C6W7_9PEZI|nr:hypothetical protein B0T14DRAFT_552646 [Immersiella caudata]
MSLIIPTTIHHSYIFTPPPLHKSRDALLAHLCNEAQTSHKTTAIFAYNGAERDRLILLLSALNITGTIVPTDGIVALEPLTKVDRVIIQSTNWRTSNIDVYTQRVGNVGRGSVGEAVSFATPHDVLNFWLLQETTKRRYGVPEIVARDGVDKDVLGEWEGRVEEVKGESPELTDMQYMSFGLRLRR